MKQQHPLSIGSESEHGFGKCPACGGNCSWWDTSETEPWVCPKMPVGWAGDPDSFSLGWLGPQMKLLVRSRFVELSSHVWWEKDRHWMGNVWVYFPDELKQHDIFDCYGPFDNFMDAVASAETAMDLSPSDVGRRFEEAIRSYEEAIRSYEEDHSVLIDNSMKLMKSCLVKSRHT